MYDRNFDVYVIRERNEEMLREVRAARLGGSSRADRAHRSGALQALAKKDRTLRQERGGSDIARGLAERT